MLAGKRIECAALAVLAAGLALAGCGGGSGSSTSTTTAGGEQLTKQELIAQGDSICQRASDDFEQLQQNPPTTAEGAATLTQRLIDITETQVSQLRELTPPPALQSSLDDYLKALDKNIAVLKQGLKAAQQNDAPGYAKAQAKTVKDQVQRLELARAVGFKECSRPAGTAPGSAGG
jgi:hypothetical protein